MLRDATYTNPVFSKPESYRAETSSMKEEFKTRPLLNPEAWTQGYKGPSVVHSKIGNPYNKTKKIIY
jgi:hypothetical protein